jgi:phospholipase/carboxylesterase
MSYRLQETRDTVTLIPTSAPPTVSVIWLHGLGADGKDFVPIVPHLGLPSTIGVRFVFPHAPLRAVTLNQGLRMRAWYDIKQLELGAIEDAEGIADSAARIGNYLAREQEQGIPARRIVLAGIALPGEPRRHTGTLDLPAVAGSARQRGPQCQPRYPDFDVSRTQ